MAEHYCCWIVCVVMVFFVRPTFLYCTPGSPKWNTKRDENLFFGFGNFPTDGGFSTDLSVSRFMCHNIITLRDKWDCDFGRDDFVFSCWKCKIFDGVGGLSAAVLSSTGGTFGYTEHLFQ